MHKLNDQIKKGANTEKDKERNNKMAREESKTTGSYKKKIKERKRK